MLKKDVIANLCGLVRNDIVLFGLFLFCNSPEGELFREIAAYSDSPLVLTTWAYHRALSL